jgi:uncharacterized protein
VHIDISSLKNTQGESLSVECHCSSVKLNLPDFLQVSPGESITVKAKLTKAGPYYLVKGNVEVELVLECARCLQEFNYHLLSQLDERFCQWKETEEAKPSDDEEEQIDTRYFTGDVIDLSKAIEDQIIVDLPMRFLCDDNCKGICPQCGHNLNISPCDCSTKAVDPRLSVLADFFEGQSDKKKEC